MSTEPLQIPPVIEYTLDLGSHKLVVTSVHRGETLRGWSVRIDGVGFFLQVTEAGDLEAAVRIAQERLRRAGLVGDRP